MLNLKLIKAITLDLDDTLWPVWPTIERAEKALENWLSHSAPKTAVFMSNSTARLEVRTHIVQSHPELQHNLSAIRHEMIRLALQRSGEDTLLADEAFKVFFDERNRVVLYEDALLALTFLSERFPIVAVSNGNADIERIGLKAYFKTSMSAQAFGVAKPDARIFHAAAEAVGVSPHNVLHIGDDHTLDVMGALNAGMQAAWLNRASSPWPHVETPHITVASLTELCDVIKAENNVGNNVKDNVEN